MNKGFVEFESGRKVFHDDICERMILRLGCDQADGITLDVLIDEMIETASREVAIDTGPLTRFLEAVREDVINELYEEQYED